MCKGMLKLPLCPYCHAVYHYRQVRENTHKEEIACHNCGKKFKVSYKKGRALLLLGVHPEIVIVDELAHTNVEGSLNEKRWQGPPVRTEAQAEPSRPAPQVPATLSLPRNHRECSRSAVPPVEHFP